MGTLGSTWKVLDRGKPVTVRFWNRVHKSDGCWEWVGRKLLSGYGLLGVPGRGTVRAHRLSWEMHFDDIPQGLLVCHHCDNPACVRPDHLFLGDQVNNMADAARKGRVKNKPMPGTAHPLAKLTDDNVRAIRISYRTGRVTQKGLAITFKVSQAVIRDVVTGRGWKHLLSSDEPSSPPYPKHRRKVSRTSQTVSSSNTNGQEGEYREQSLFDGE